MLTGCATISKSDETIITITSEPSEALVRINEIPRGKTPLQVSLNNGSSHSIIVEKDGYFTEYAIISKKVRIGSQVADLFIWGLIGNIIDLINDEGYYLQPDTIHVVLTPNESTTIND